MDTFDTYFDKAIQCYKDNNINLAIQNFTKCLELDPENYGVYNNRGLMYYNIDDFGKAIQDFNKSLLLNPNNLDGYYNRGLAYQQFGNYDKALEDFNIVKSNSSEFENLETEIQKTLDLKSGKSISLNFLSNFTEDNGDPKVAFNSGKFFFDNNDFKSAINSFTNALSYQPSFVDAYLHRARCYSNIKQFDKAIDDYVSAEKYIEHKDVIKANIGNVYSQMGQFELSLEYLNKAVEMDPYNYINYYYRGLTKAKMNKNRQLYF